MQKQLLCFIGFLFLLNPLHAQFPNLVPNPGFEEYNPCFTPPMPGSDDTCYTTCRIASLPNPYFNQGGGHIFGEMPQKVT